MNFRKDFPIFDTHPDLIYLDSTATSQKPGFVLDGVKDYLSSSYANIHRWSYNISTESERLYKASKQALADNIGASSWKEVIYTANSTYALNLLSQSIWRTWLLKKWDKVLVSVVEHHANIVPWQILAEDYWIQVEFIEINNNYSLNLDDLTSKLDDSVKIISLTHVSNVTGQIFELNKVSELLDKKYSQNKPLFIVDGSQSVPHFRVDVDKIWCDALFFTGHKIFAEWGIGVLWAKETLLNELQPIFSGGGAIWHVSKDWFTHANKLPDKFEPGTPNLNGAVSLLKAFEYIDSIWGYPVLETTEHELMEYALEKFHDLDGVEIIWSHSSQNRVWVFTFVVDGIHSFDISDYLANYNVCIRAGQHCAEPLMVHQNQSHTCRMSLHIYNTKDDIDRFFEVLEQAINELK